MVNIATLQTEQRNPKTLHLDQMSIRDVLQVMNEEDQNVLSTIQEAIPDIERVVEAIIAALKNGGRLVYVGAGTSGRMGIMDAVECVPTFSTDGEVVALMAGGNEAFVRAVEGAEDSATLAEQDLRSLQVNENDVVVGIAASGRTPYVIGALTYAKSVHATAVALSCNKQAEISRYADLVIEVDAGPEVLSGSTRLKAGTCQKLILNMLSTVSMIGVGKVYGNLMVDMKATNAKLVERAKRMVMQATDCSYKQAEETLVETEQNIKVAILMILTSISKEEAKKRLEENEGFIRKSIL